MDEEAGVRDRFVKVTAVQGVFFQILSSRIGRKGSWRIVPETKLAALFSFSSPLGTKGAPCG